jgi:hypothetical protein
MLGVTPLNVTKCQVRSFITYVTWYGRKLWGLQKRVGKYGKCVTTFPKKVFSFTAVNVIGQHPANRSCCFR